MRILFFQNICSPYRIDFFNELGKYCDLTVIFDRENAKSRDSSWISNNFINFKYHFLKGINFSDDGKIPTNYKKYLKDKYDIIIIGNYHTPTAVLVSKYLKKKKIKYGVAVDGIFKHDTESKIKLKLKRGIFENAHFFLTTGKYSVDVINFYGGNNAYIYPFSSFNDAYVLKNIISIDEKNKIKEELSLKEKNVLFVGQFIYRKGIDVLFEAMKDVDANLIMIGGKLNDEYLKQNINIITPGFLKPNEIEKYYLASDVLVLPTREDQWGLVVGEALAKGLPVITTNMCLSAYEMIDGNGMIIELDKDILSKAINEILNLDIDKYQNMQKKAIEKASEYTLEKMALKHIEIFNDLLK